MSSIQNSSMTIIHMDSLYRSATLAFFYFTFLILLELMMNKFYDAIWWHHYTNANFSEISITCKHSPSTSRKTFENVVCKIMSIFFQVDGLVQDYCISIANSPEMQQSYIEPLKCQCMLKKVIPVDLQGTRGSAPWGHRAYLCRMSGSSRGVDRWSPWLTSRSKPVSVLSPRSHWPAPAGHSHTHLKWSAKAWSLTLATLNLFYVIQQGKSEGFDSCDRPSNVTKIGSKIPNHRFFGPYDLEIWWMTSKKQKGYVKLCASFQSRLFLSPATLNLTDDFEKQ